MSSESSARQRIHMKNQALFSSKYKSKKLKYHLLQFLIGALRVNIYVKIHFLRQWGHEPLQFCKVPQSNVLKVGSCPNNDNFFLVLFCVEFKYFYLSCRENGKILLRICLFSFVCFLYVGIPNLKIVLSHVHKWVSSDVIR